MYYLYCLILLCTGAGLAMFGLKKFGLSLALSFAIPAITVLAIFNWLGITWLIVIGVFTLLIFFMATPLTYMSAWVYAILLMSIPFFMITKDESIHKIIIYIAMPISAVGVFIFRKHLKAVVIGISSGFCLGFGLAAILSGELFKAGNYADALFLPLVLTFLLMVGGIVFQYLYIIKRNPQLADAHKISAIV